MLSKYTLLFFLLISAHFLVAQNTVFDKEIKEIDSLIQYNQFEAAQRKADNLYQKLSISKEQKKYKTELLELKFKQAYIQEKEDKLPSEWLKILLEITDKAEAEQLHSLSCRIYLLIALAYEKTGNYNMTDKYLKLAYQKINKNNLVNLYSTYYIRKGSYHRFLNELDSTHYYAERAKEFVEKYHNENDLVDSYILLGVVALKTQNYNKSLEYAFLLLDYYKKFNDMGSLCTGYNNIANCYLKMENFSKALLYNDSAYVFLKKIPLSYKYFLPKLRYEIYDAAGNTDSAYHYFKQYHNVLQLFQEEEGNIKTKKLEKQYQNDKKEAVIKNKNQQLMFIGGLLFIIVFGSTLLYRKNRQINRKNEIINKQVIDLSKTLEQKQMLFSELQHRVKNNLQHVISILEIQKESADYNNIDELIRSNQNRIHSIALLHKKLNVSDNVSDVDLKRYITELSELVKDSYDNHKKKIHLNIKCEVETISIEKALPIGLIITELVSNSMKHAFKNRNIGIIHIELTKDKDSGQNIFYYADNGDGFDFNKSNEKGLGQEIIKGLIDQLDGTVTAKSDNGFELTVEF